MRTGIDWTSTKNLSDGLFGTGRTLEQMAAFVRRDANSLWLREKALEIVSGCGGHEFSCEIHTLFHYVRDQITYRRDPVNVEWIQDARRTIDYFRTGDCDDLVVCLASLLAALGHKSRFVCIGKDASNYSHVYLEVLTKSGRWLPLDPTPEQAPVGWEARGLHRAVYEIWGNSTNKIFGWALIGGLLYLAFK